MAKVETHKSVNKSYGKGGYVEGKERVSVPVTKVEGKDTGIKVTVRGHDVTPKDIRDTVKSYPKDVKTVVSKMSNETIRTEFLD